MLHFFSKWLTRGVISTSTRNYGCSVGVLGVPFEKGQVKVGVANAPGYIRKAGLIEELVGIDEKMDVVDFGDVSYKVDKNIEEAIPNMKSYEHIVACAQELSKCVTHIINQNRVCLTLGGDHAIAIATVDGHIKAKSDVALLWIDAHADLNTNKTSVTGNVHGMPMALLACELSDYWPYLPGMDWQKPIISIRNVAYIGLRSVDQYERLIIDKLGITAYGMEDIERYGIYTVVNMALERIDPDNNRSLHVSFDIDALDTLEAPSTGTSVRGGLTLREGLLIMERTYKTGRLNAVDLVEVNPSIGSDNDVKKTVEAAIHILSAACGYNRRGRKPFNVYDMPLQTFNGKTSE